MKKQILKNYQFTRGFLGGTDSEECLQCRRPGFEPWVGKITGRREWQSTLVFLLEEFSGQRGPAGHSPWGHKESDMTE